MDTGASVRSNVIINRDCLAALKDMPDKSVDCCVTSPPYYGLRDYGVEGQIGREATPEQYVERLAEVFVQLYRVLSDSGTFWLNISDSYCGTGSKGACLDPKNPKGRNGQKVSLTQNVRGVQEQGHDRDSVDAGVCPAGFGVVSAQRHYLAEGKRNAGECKRQAYKEL